MVYCGLLVYAQSGSKVYFYRPLVFPLYRAVLWSSLKKLWTELASRVTVLSPKWATVGREPLLVTGVGGGGDSRRKEGGGGGRQREAGVCVRWGINGF